MNLDDLWLFETSGLTKPVTRKLQIGFVCMPTCQSVAARRHGSDFKASSERPPRSRVRQAHPQPGQDVKVGVSGSILDMLPTREVTPEDMQRFSSPGNDDAHPQPGQDVKVGVSGSILDMLPTWEVTPEDMQRFSSPGNDEKKTRCTICLEDYALRETIRSLPCLHLFHTKCIDQWLTEQSDTCPICRRSVHDTLGSVNISK
jgi:hypothetical protein